MAENEKRHPIQVVADRTGLTKDLLRAWERRYGVVEPGRTDTGRRRYSDRDIEKLRRLKLVTDAGRTIGQVAQLTSRELEDLAAEDAVHRSGQFGQPSADHEESSAIHYREAMAAILQLDGARLRKILQRAMLLLSPAEVIDGIVAPLLEEMGNLWAEGRLSVAHEHAATSVLRATINGAIDTMEIGRPDSLHVLVATPAGQRHDLGAVLVAATATAAGCRVTYLGADLPVVDIADAALRQAADIVALSIIHPADDPDLPADLARLRQLLPSEIPIVAGGRASESYRGKTESSGIRWMRDLGELRELFGEADSRVR